MSQIVTAARRYLGTPFRHCGRNAHGLDCLGLLLVVAHDLGLTEWDITNYSDQVDVVQMRQGVERFCERIPTAAKEPGDVLLFRMRGIPQHLGIATDIGVIHSHQLAKRVVEHSFDVTWQRRLVAVFRWRGEGWQH